MRVMVCEDERLAREELLYLLGREPDVELLPWAGSGTQLLELAAEHRPQVVFLDIHVPGVDGMETAKRLSKLAPAPNIVFATAYEQYAIEAFRLEAVDYLLKPYDEERLAETLQRIRQRLGAAGSAGAAGAGLGTDAGDGGAGTGAGGAGGRVEAGAGAGAGPSAGGRLGLDVRSSPGAGVALLRPRLLLDDGSRMVVIDPSGIAYAVKDEKNTRLHMLDGTVHTAKLTLSELEEKLGEPFFRTHRSNLVQLDCIEELEPWFNGAYNLILKDAPGSRVPLARGSVKELLKRLQGH